MSLKNIFLLICISLFSNLMSFSQNYRQMIIDDLILSAYEGNANVFFETLKKHQLDINASDHLGITSLHAAICGNHLELVDLIIKKGANINCQNKDGTTPLHDATFYNHIDIVRLLLKNKAKTNIFNKLDITPLMVAVNSNNLDIVKLFINYGADVNFGKIDGPTCINIAAYKGNTEIVKILLQKGADINKKLKGYSPFHSAVASNNIEILKLLLTYKANINDKTDEGYSPLALALNPSNFNDINTIKFLLDNGANPNDKLKDGRTILFLACISKAMSLFDIDTLKPICKTVIVENLINVKANVNFPNNSGATPLMIACGSGCIDIVKILLGNGADINALTNDGENALMFACHGSGNVEIVSYLIQHGINLNITDKSGENSLHKLACGVVVNSYPKEIDAIIADTLIDNGIKLEIKDTILNFTPLMSAIFCRNVPLAKELIIKGADVNANNGKYYTALSLAKENNLVAIEKLLIENGAIR